MIAGLPTLTVPLHEIRVTAPPPPPPATPSNNDGIAARWPPSRTVLVKGSKTGPPARPPPRELVEPPLPPATNPPPPPAPEVAVEVPLDTARVPPPGPLLVPLADASSVPVIVRLVSATKATARPPMNVAVTPLGTEIVPWRMTQIGGPPACATIPPLQLVSRLVSIVPVCAVKLAEVAGVSQTFGR
jgi:hypothetical protein